MLEGGPHALWTVDSDGMLRGAEVDDISVAAWLPVVLALVAFVGYCLVDLVRADVRYLPKWAWVVVCLISIPVGGIVYLVIGKKQ